MAAVPDPLPQLDSWPAIIVAVSAAAAALLVPLTGFLMTFFDYCIGTQKAEALKPEVARDVAQVAGTALFDSMAVVDLTAAIKDLTVAIRADTALEEAQHASQFTQVLQRLTDVLNHHDDTHENPPRGGRRSAQLHRGHLSRHACEREASQGRSSLPVHWAVHAHQPGHQRAGRAAARPVRDHHWADCDIRPGDTGGGGAGAVRGAADTAWRIFQILRAFR